MLKADNEKYNQMIAGVATEKPLFRYMNAATWAGLAPFLWDAFSVLFSQ